MTVIKEDINLAKIFRRAYTDSIRNFLESKKNFNDELFRKKFAHNSYSHEKVF